jgi:alkylhydroperoxidase family enzyme
MDMQTRLDYSNIVPGIGRAMAGLEHLIRSSTLAKDEPLLIELVKIRVSQINGCAY